MWFSAAVQLMAKRAASNKLFIFRNFSKWINLDFDYFTMAALAAKAPNIVNDVMDSFLMPVASSWFVTFWTFWESAFV